MHQSTFLYTLSGCKTQVPGVGQGSPDSKVISPCFGLAPVPSTLLRTSHLETGSDSCHDNIRLRKDLTKITKINGFQTCLSGKDSFLQPNPTQKPSKSIVWLERRRLGASLTWSSLILEMAQTPWDSGAQFVTQDQVQVPYFIKKGSDAHRGKGTFPIEMRCPPGYREIRASTEHIPRVICRVQINGAGPGVEQCVTCTSVQGSLHIPLPQPHMSPGLPRFLSHTPIPRHAERA